MKNTDIEAWLTARKLAAARVRQEARDRPCSPAESYRRAMSLREAVGRRPDADDVEGVEFHLRWARLRRAMAKQ